MQVNLSIKLTRIQYQQDLYMSTSIKSTLKLLFLEQQPVKTLTKSEKIFRYLCIIVVLILLFCIPGFMHFRKQCQKVGIYVFSSDSLKWCIFGFLGIFIIKYSYFTLMWNTVQKIIHPKFIQQQRIKKTKHVLKLTYDSFFYTFTTTLAYYIFSNQYWFPSIVGGNGSCSNIYKQYPNWPSDKRTDMQIFFMIQLGIHIFSVFEVGIIKRKTENKFYQYTLHHFVAATLILFSMMCNQIAAGLMILIVHDASDIFMSLARAYAETKFKDSRKLSLLLLFCLITSWTYMRLIIYPFCLLSNVYVNKPMETDFWYIIHFQYLYLLSMAFILLGLHIFWTYFLIKSGSRAIKHEFVNAHEKKVKQ